MRDAGQDAVIDTRLMALKQPLLEWVSDALKQVSDSATVRKNGWSHCHFKDEDDWCDKLSAANAHNRAGALFRSAQQGAVPEDDRGHEFEEVSELSTYAGDAAGDEQGWKC